MKKLKRPLALLLALCMIFALSACGFRIGGSDDDEDDERSELKKPHQRSAEDELLYGSDTPAAPAAEPAPAAPAAQQGNPRTPDFVVYGLDNFLALNETASFSTICQNDESKTTTGYYTVVAYEREPYEGGKETIHLCFQVRFADSNAETYYPYFLWIYEDYYNSKLMNDTCKSVGDYKVSYEVDWNGERQTIELQYSSSSTGWINHRNTYQTDLYYFVPAGYDGIVIGVTPPISGVGNSDYIYDYATRETPFFRAA